METMFELPCKIAKTKTTLTLTVQVGGPSVCPGVIICYALIIKFSPLFPFISNTNKYCFPFISWDGYNRVKPCYILLITKANEFTSSSVLQT